LGRIRHKTDDTQKSQRIFCYIALGDGSKKQSILQAHFATHHCTQVHANHMSLQTNCSRFRTVGTLPIFRFVSEDTIGLEASSCVAFAIEKEKKPHAI